MIRASSSRQPDPTPKEIRERSAAIRRTWGPKEYRQRRVTGIPDFSIPMNVKFFCTDGRRPTKPNNDEMLREY